MARLVAATALGVVLAVSAASSAHADKGDWYRQAKPVDAFGTVVITSMGEYDAPTFLLDGESSCIRTEATVTYDFRLKGRQRPVLELIYDKTTQMLGQAIAQSLGESDYANPTLDE